MITSSTKSDQNHFLSMELVTPFSPPSSRNANMGFLGCTPIPSLPKVKFQSLLKAAGKKSMMKNDPIIQY